MPNFSNYAEQLAAHTKIFHGKDTNKPSAKANFICILPRRSIQNEVKDSEKLDLPFVLCRTLLNAERNASAKTGSESGLYPIFAVFTEDKRRFVQI